MENEAVEELQKKMASLPTFTLMTGATGSGLTSSLGRAARERGQGVLWVDVNSLRDFESVEMLIRQRFGEPKWRLSELFYKEVRYNVFERLNQAGQVWSWCRLTRGGAPIILILDHLGELDDKSLQRLLANASKADRTGMMAYWLVLPHQRLREVLRRMPESEKAQLSPQQLHKLVRAALELDANQGLSEQLMDDIIYYCGADLHKVWYLVRALEQKIGPFQLPMNFRLQDQDLELCSRDDKVKIDEILKAGKISDSFNPGSKQGKLQDELPRITTPQQGKFLEELQRCFKPVREESLCVGIASRYCEDVFHYLVAKWELEDAKRSGKGELSEEVAKLELRVRGLKGDLKEREARFNAYSRSR